MQLYPAIDMLDGNAVRLRQGRRDDVTIFGNPVDLAAKWREQGATYLHLVDLTAAFDGQTKHLPLIREVIRAFGGNVELGGGLRTMADIALRMRDMGVTTLIYTDISRDGMMQGPNFAATKRLIDKTQMDIIGSGGVSSISDLLKLQEIGCAGAILGRAMYEGAFTVPDALEAIQTADKGE